MSAATATPATNEFNEPVQWVRYRDFATRTIFKAMIIYLLGYQVHRNIESPFWAFLWILPIGVLFAQKSIPGVVSVSTTLEMGDVVTPTSAPHEE